MKGKWRVAWLAAALAVLVILVAGCSSGQDGSSSAGGSSASSATSASSSSSAAASADKAPDYSQKSSWYQVPEVTKDVDTFYIYSTVYNGLNEGDPDYAKLDNAEMLDGVAAEYVSKSSAFADSTNVFEPYYRQASARHAGETWMNTGTIESAVKSTPYDDITAALDYYFKNYNGGRPFIIAGHSQGAALTKFALEGYFKEHPDYYERMVAAYPIGYAVTKDDLEANPHMKFATGETDTGAIISWNTEGKKNGEENASTLVLLPNAISINPLNWKLDNTYAPASENMGSYMLNEKTGAYEMTDVGADAQVDPVRGVVVTNAHCSPVPLPEIMGPDSRHDNDYSLYYSNIKDNVAKRIAAYKAGH